MTFVVYCTRDGVVPAGYIFRTAVRLPSLEHALRDDEPQLVGVVADHLAGQHERGDEGPMARQTVWLENAH